MIVINLCRQDFVMTDQDCITFHFGAGTGKFLVTTPYVF